MCADRQIFVKSRLFSIALQAGLKNHNLSEMKWALQTRVYLTAVASSLSVHLSAWCHWIDLSFFFFLRNDVLQEFRGGINLTILLVIFSTSNYTTSWAVCCALLVQARGMNQCFLTPKLHIAFFCDVVLKGVITKHLYYKLTPVAWC